MITLDAARTTALNNFLKEHFPDLENSNRDDIHTLGRLLEEAEAGSTLYRGENRDALVSVVREFVVDALGRGLSWENCTQAQRAARIEDNATTCDEIAATADLEAEDARNDAERYRAHAERIRNGETSDPIT